MSDMLENLNPAQREAVVDYRHASLIIAGAGSGKTRVLTSRIAYMLQEGVPGHRILALTFTNKAAREMRERIMSMVTPAAGRGLWMGTFHSVFARVLRAESETVHYPSSFTIYDTADSRNLVKLAIREMELDEDQYKPGVIAARISRAKNNLVTPETYAANAIWASEDGRMRIPRFADLYRLYTRRCRENGAMDFDDLLVNTNLLLRDHPAVLEKYREQFHYILVDEYQDTNYAQYVIVKMLGGKYNNVCVVGDDAQSIYSFRGAKIENILRFQNDFPDARVFKLEQNYRSTQTIVNAANSVIRKNSRQLSKTPFSAAETGDPIKVVKAYTDREEASLIAGEIYSVVRNRNTPYSGIAILYRTNAQSRTLEESLRNRNIPYKIYGGFSFYQHKEVKDLLAYIRLVINPRDNEAFRRVINTPSRGIGDVTVARIAAAAESGGIGMWEALRSLSPNDMGISGAAAGRVTAFAGMIGDLSAARHTMEAHQLGLEIANRSGLIGTYRMQQAPESISALENLEELINSIRVYTDDREKRARETGEPLDGKIGIEEWMQEVALLTDQDNDKPEDHNKVTLMTVHAAKGLEFDRVFVAGLEENLFPSQMSLGNADGLEEERRLFYVALTRAKQGAVLSFAESRFRWGEMGFSRPSRFLSEIDPQYLDDSGSRGAPQPAGRPEPNQNQRPEPGRYGQHPAGPYGRHAGPRAGYPPKDRPPGQVEPVRPSTHMRRIVPDTARAADPVPRPAPAASGEYAVGARVEHAKFGPGIITAIEEWSNDTKLTVDFGPTGTKVLLKKFARLQIL